VSVIPQEIPDFGSSQLAPRQNPEFRPGVDFTTEDYFVWSRLDGRTSLREVILMVGLGIQKSIGILRKLRRNGAVLLPGEDPRVVAAALRTAPVREAPGTLGEDRERELPELDALSADEERTLAEDVALEEGEKRRIIQMMRLVAGSDYFALLGVGRKADKRELKRAYFRLSKEFHPDRHYKQNLGTFGPLLNVLFETATEAFQVLTDDERRAAHLAALDGAASPARAVRAESTQGSAPVPRAVTAQPTRTGRSRQAAEMFERACDREVGGDAAGALRMFRAAIEADPQPRYLRRAAKCALGFGQLEEAEAYAEKAVSMRADDASYARLMADVLRACGRLEEAEKILVRALELPSASDALARELKGDLEAVRAALGATSAEG
jgi:curved DNA-binding protein CbpA